MNGQISQDEINAILWRACDTFRGTVDPAEYKNYILVMLFVKYISDAWRDHYDAYRAQLGDDEARVRRRMRPSPEGERVPAPQSPSKMSCRKIVGAGAARYPSKPCLLYTSPSPRD